uniref:hypothetical protein n=1 Tax=Candidatus Fimenecus sp. TaxID=3022888 RepID=UPI004027A37E
MKKPSVIAAANGKATYAKAKRLYLQLYKKINDKTNISLSFLVQGRTDTGLLPRFPRYIVCIII